MRLANGIVLDKEKTFGVLKFSALRHEVRVENEDGTTTEVIKRRTYDLKCSQQERTIQVSIPAEIPVKDYPYNAEVELVNPVADTVANANYRGADVEWYIKADDIVLKNKGGQPAGNPQNHAPQGQQKNQKQPMENVAGYEDYEKEFREVSLPEYRWLAQTMLTQAIEDSGCQMDGSLIISMPDYISKDKCWYTFQFSIETIDWKNPASRTFTYIGCY